MQCHACTKAASREGTSSTMPMWQPAVGYMMLLASALAGTLVIRSKNERLAVLVELRAALLSGLVAIGLLALRGHVPLLVVVVPGQAAVLCAFAFLHESLSRVLGRPSWLRLFLAFLLPPYCVALAFFTLIHNDVDARLLIASAGVSAMLAWTVLLVRKPAPAALKSPLRWMFWLLVIAIGLRVSRCAVTLTLDPNPNLIVLDPIQNLIAYLILLSALAQAAGTFWISVCAQREDDRARADTDGLTGLLNRRAFEEILARDLLALGNESLELSLLLIDLDFFKSMNDEFGHQAGDTVLQRVSMVLRRSLRPSDTMARFGGDEFAVLLRSAEPGQALLVAERVRQNLIHMRNLPGKRQVTASLGVSTALIGDTPPLLLERADHALYRSKDRGRNRLTHFGDDDSPADHNSLASALIQ